MIIYLILYFASVAVFLYTLNFDKKTQKTIMTYYMIVLGVFVGMGDMLGGYDRYIYGELFDSMADVTRAGGNPWTSNSFGFYGGEFGYGTLCALISFMTGNRYIFIFVVTIVIYILLIVSLRDYVDNAPFAVVMFMGLWFFFTFTYIRQVIGCTVCWLAVRFVVGRDLKRFLLVLFIGYSFHNSVLIFLPIYFLPIKKYSLEKVLLVMVAALLLGLTSVPQAMFEAYGEVDKNRVNAAGYAVDAGFRWAYLIEAVFFLYVILSNYRNISNKVKDVVMLNMALIFCAILLVFVKSENGGRLGWMYMIGLFCTLSNICVKRKRLLPQGVMILVVSLLLFYRVLNAWSFNLTPYKTFLTPGHTAAEWIYEKYEYNPYYDVNKFHR